MSFTPRVSPEMQQKLQALNPPATALLDSEEITVTGSTTPAERVLTDQGTFISSPANDWVLAGPF